MLEASDINQIQPIDSGEHSRRAHGSHERSGAVNILESEHRFLRVGTSNPRNQNIEVSASEHQILGVEISELRDSADQDIWNPFHFPLHIWKYLLTVRYNNGAMGNGRMTRRR